MKSIVFWAFMSGVWFWCGVCWAIAALWFDAPAWPLYAVGVGLAGCAVMTRRGVNRVVQNLS